MTSHLKKIGISVVFRGIDITDRVDQEDAIGLGLLAFEIMSRQEENPVSRLNSLEQEVRSLRRSLSKHSRC